MLIPTSNTFCLLSTVYAAIWFRERWIYMLYSSWYWTTLHKYTSYVVQYSTNYYTEGGIITLISYSCIVILNVVYNQLFSTDWGSHLKEVIITLIIIYDRKSIIKYFSTSLNEEKVQTQRKQVDDTTLQRVWFDFPSLGILLLWHHCHIFLLSGIFCLFSCDLHQ